MQGQLVRLREHVMGDLEPFCDWQMDSEVARYLSWLPRTREQCVLVLLDAIEQQSVLSRVRYFFAVEEVQSGAVVGDVGFTKTGDTTADCGWFIRRSFWGNGFASEAVRCLISIAFGEVGLNRLAASAFIENRASIRVAEKCGFHPVRKTLERVRFEIGAREFRPGESPCLPIPSYPK
jgi:[ribosomal protein S5]-alanine N-acetyltransferase